MKLNPLFPLLLVAACCVTCVIGRSAASDSGHKANLSAPEIAGYKKWKVVNEKAFFVPASIAVDCAPATLRSMETSASVRPSSHPSHFDKFVRIFVNDKGKAAMFAKTPHFPVGSVVVKEKLPSETSKPPELLTVMIKRAAGFDTPKGDWEYLVAEGSGQKAYERGKLANCASCHDAQRNSDYVFRGYLPGNAPMKPEIDSKR